MWKAPYFTRTWEAIREGGRLMGVGLCYGQRVCVSPESTCWNPHGHCVGVQVGPLGVLEL